MFIALIKRKPIMAPVEFRQYQRWVGSLGEPDLMEETEVNLYLRNIVGHQSGKLS